MEIPSGVRARRDPRLVLLAAGIAAALVSAAMNVVVPLQNPDYDWTSQTVSELSAVDAPTRPLWLGWGVLYSLLFLAFGFGVWHWRKDSRALKVAGVSLVVAAILGLYWPPMHQREVLASGGGTLTDTLHIAWTIAWGVLTMTAMIATAIPLGRGFRIYTVITLAVLLGAGVMTSLSTERMVSDLPTPGMGVWERVDFLAFLLWLIVAPLALVKERRPRH